CQRYEAGRVNTKDLPRPGKAHVVTNDATISAVDEVIRKNRRITKHEIAVKLSINSALHNPQKDCLCQSLCTVEAQASVRELEEGENGCLPEPAVSTLKPSTPFLCTRISVSMPMAVIHSCTVPHEL
ncbi:hypothetical protein AVEN_44527-1, partial [Araneus ventricosus]